MDILIIAIKGILERPLRSLLTLLTAAIGIASVVSSISILYGARHLIRKDMAKLSLDVVLVENKSPLLGRMLDSGALNLRDIDFIKERIPEIPMKMAPLRSLRMKAVYPDKGTSHVTAVIWTDQNFFQMYDLPRQAGEFLSREDVVNGNMVCVLDQGVAVEDYKQLDCVDKKVVISKGRRELELKIKGVLSDPYSLRSDEREVDTAFAARNILKSRLKFKNIYVPITLLEDNDRTRLNASTNIHINITKKAARKIYSFRMNCRDRLSRNINSRFINKRTASNSIMK